MENSQKTVAITGANRGIGLALARKFHENGYKIYGLCRQGSQELRDMGAEVIENIDVTNLEALRAAEAELPELDILINNAGLLIGDSLESVEIEKIQAQFEVNTLGPLKVGMTLAKKLKSGGTLGIVTSRMGSIRDNTSGGQYGYRLSKAAANAVGKSLSEDLRRNGVCVLMLHPGYVRTEMTGGNGLIDTTESAEGLFKILTEKGIDKTGSFWHTTGEELPW